MTPPQLLQLLHLASLTPVLAIATLWIREREQARLTAGPSHYLRQAKAALALAAAADSAASRRQFQQIAATWERLARERLSVPKRKTR